MRSTQDKDISIIWTSFLMKVVGLWLAADRNEQFRRDFALIYTVSALFISVCMACRDIYYTWGNLRECVFIVCNILYVAMVLLKIGILYSHKMEFFKLVTFTQQNFWRPHQDPQEMIILTGCKKVCTVTIIIISFCCQGSCAGYLISPLIGNMGKNESDRALPFNLWVDFPVSLSPYFEILFTIQILCVYHVGICYICFDNFLCIVNFHVASQFRILQYRLKNLHNVIKVQLNDQESDTKVSRYANACYIKLKNCVQLHQMLTEYCLKLENIFTIIVLGHVMFLAIVICLLGFQLFLADTPPSKKVSLVLNLGGTFFQFLMFTYSCDNLIRQSVDVGNAVFSGPWANLPMDKVGTVVRKNLIIVIMRSHRVCSLTAGGFFPISLETYTAVLSTAMSYFTLLKRSSDVEDT
ncbi:PREDICTED: odorant receptor Or2-like [Eufriesea mexicana]|uniref:odorant receptor Or2-like n=1 Tax=Eufriesea mexicana TaxID=516756 RepID=UPI00083C72C0|nr:PREDICTED: odorant receptor Or2-like [Eufriesea mexicana]